MTRQILCDLHDVVSRRPWELTFTQKSNQKLNDAGSRYCSNATDDSCVDKEKGEGGAFSTV